MAGKGSAPRKGANQKAYEENWEQIFGDKSENKKNIKETKQDNKVISDRQSNQSNHRQSGRQE